MWLALVASLLSVAQALQGGADSKPERFPGSIAFYLPKTATQERCTATFVAPRIFLTAAHCFDRFEKDGFSPLIIFVSNEMGSDHKPVVKSQTRFLVRAPVIHPDYYKGFWSALRNKWFGSNPDLALIKINEDLEGLTTADVAPSDFHVGLPLLIGGYGPAFADQECVSSPCPLRMGTARVSSTTSREVLLNGDSLFLTGGDSGGPAYELRDGRPVVVAVNQGCDGLHKAGVAKVSILSKIDFAWYRANLERLIKGRK